MTSVPVAALPEQLREAIVPSQPGQAGLDEAQTRYEELLSPFGTTITGLGTVVDPVTGQPTSARYEALPESVRQLIFIAAESTTVIDDGRAVVVAFIVDDAGSPHSFVRITEDEPARELTRLEPTYNYDHDQNPDTPVDDSGLLPDTSVVILAWPDTPRGGA